MFKTIGGHMAAISSIDLSDHVLCLKGRIAF